MESPRRDNTTWQQCSCHLSRHHRSKERCPCSCSCGHAHHNYISPPKPEEQSHRSIVSNRLAARPCIHTILLLLFLYIRQEQEGNQTTATDLSRASDSDRSSVPAPYYIYIYIYIASKIHILTIASYSPHNLKNTHTND
jgi:hypothetical protein